MGKLLPNLALAALVLVAACSDGDDPQVPEMTGTWSGLIFLDEDNPITFEMTVLERDHLVSGSGFLRFEVGPAIATTVEGIHVHPNVSFTGSGARLPDFNFTGVFQDRTTIRGQLFGGGFEGDSLTFDRVE